MIQDMYMEGGGGGGGGYSILLPSTPSWNKCTPYSVSLIVHMFLLSCIPSENETDPLQVLAFL